MEMGNLSSNQQKGVYNVPLHALATSQVENDDSLLESENLSESRDGFLLTEALRTAQQAPDVREDRIAELKARVSSGAYEVDCLDLAQAILREDLALFSARS